MRPFKWKAGAGAGFLIVALAGCDIIDPIESNPNAVPNASIDQLFVGVQVNWIVSETAQESRLVAVWMNQMDGTDRQFDSFAQYVIDEGTGSGSFSNLYTGGGLIDLRLAQGQARDDGRTLYLGILEVYEAYMIGMGAAVYGDIPYSEAVNPDISEPNLDAQRAVYDAVIVLLDQAIADLTTGAGAGPASADFAFGGDAAAWIDVAQTAKARFQMHWGEVDGATAYNNVLTTLGAANGIRTSSGDWKTTQSTTTQESNLWSQFMDDRSAYISAGATLVNLMNARADERLPIYYALDGNGVYSGSAVGNPVGDPGASASVLSLTGYGARDFQLPAVTAAETYFLIAEAEFMTGDATAALAALDMAVAMDATRNGVTLAVPSATLVAGTMTLADIMTEKYMSQFVNRDAWNDYKRTCVLPATTFNNLDIPGRLFYSASERETNSNIPEPNDQPLRNANDPAAC